jgi:hypothetical protein
VSVMTTNFKPIQLSKFQLKMRQGHFAGSASLAGWHRDTQPPVTSVLLIDAASVHIQPLNTVSVYVTRGAAAPLARPWLAQVYLQGWQVFCAG